MVTSFDPEYDQWQDGEAGGTPIKAEVLQAQQDALLGVIQDAGITAAQLAGLVNALGGTVRADQPQSFTDAQQAAARDNLRASANPLPIYARGLGLKNAYDPVRKIYNAKASNGRGLEAGLAQVAAGGTCHDVYIGASDMCTPDGNPGTSDQLHMWPEIEAQAIVQAGYPRGGTGLVPWADTIGLDANRVATTGSWTNYGAFYYTSAAGATIAAAADQGGIGVEVWIDNNITATGVTLKVGAGAATALTTTGTGAVKRFYVPGAVAIGDAITLTANGALLPYFWRVVESSGYVKHQVARSSSGALQGGSYGIAGEAGSWSPFVPTYNTVGRQAYAALPKGRLVSGTTASGSTTITLASSTNGYSADDIGVPITGSGIQPSSTITAVASATSATMSKPATVTASGVAVTINQSPARVTIELGPNDLTGPTSYTVQQIVAGIYAVATQFPVSDIRLSIMWHIGVIPLATWQDFAAQMYQLADTLDCRLIDWFDRLGTFQQMQAGRLLGQDGYHLGRGANATFGRANAATTLG